MKKRLTKVLVTIISIVLILSFFTSCTNKYKTEFFEEATSKLEHSGLILAQRDGKAGYIDKKGNTKIDFVYDYATNFVNGVALVQLGAKYLVIDKKGKAVTKKRYDGAVVDPKGKVIWVQEGAFWGLVSLKGKEIIAPTTYTTFGFFSEGLATVGKKIGSEESETYGYINNKGKLVIDLKYKAANEFSNGLANVKEDDKGYIYIDKKGNKVISEVFLFAEKFIDNHAIIRVNSYSKYSIIDKKGKTIVGDFDALDRVVAGGFIGKKNAQMLLLDTKGKTIMENTMMIQAFFDLYIAGASETSLKVFDGKAREVTKGVDISKVNGLFYDLETLDFYLVIKNDETKVSTVYDKKGKKLFETDKVSEFHSVNKGAILITDASDKRRQGFMDMKGNFKVDPKYDRITAYRDYYVVQKEISEGKKACAIMDKKLKEITKFDFEDIGW